MVLEIENNEVIGERELFWLDFYEAKPYLKEGYFFTQQDKPLTYLQYFENVLKVADISAK